MGGAETTRLTAGLKLRIQLARALRWEFWPGWLFYIPIILWCVVCAFRYRHWTAFSAVNPGMDNGSVVGERKSVSLLGLQATLPECVPRTLLLPAQPAAALTAVEDLAAATGWPLVLKPDIGQRGRGVAIIHSRAQAQAYLQTANFAVLAQSYAKGEEYGVFVCRQPGTQNYEVSSLTHKALPALRGDGQHTLAELILAQPRTWLIAPLLFARFAPRLEQVPAAGARVAVVELGAHCRGAEFRDAMIWRSAALTAAMQRIAMAIPGFDFGRIDLRCPSPEALQAGQSLQVLEINGVTSEPAHYYHPGTPWRRGLAGFCAHWTRAFALGRENLDAGRASALSPWQLLRLFHADLQRFDSCEAAAAAARAQVAQTGTDWTAAEGWAQ